MKTRKRCEICDSKALRKIKFGKETIQLNDMDPNSVMVTNKDYGACLEMVRCQACGFIQTQNILEQEQIVKLYTNMEDDDYLSAATSRGQSNANQIDKYIKDYIKKDEISVFEIGVGSGGALHYLQDYGYKVKGLEPSKALSDFAITKYGLDVSNTSFEEYKVKEKYDVVIALDIIEHVASPNEFVAKMKKLVKEDGIVILGTPNVGSLVAKVLGNNWWHIRPPHLYYFNVDTTRKILEKHDLNVYASHQFHWQVPLGYLFDSVIKLMFKKTTNLSKVLSYPIKVHAFDSRLYIGGNGKQS